MTTEHPTPADIQQLLIKTTMKVLKPLVRLLLRNGVGYPMLIEELKTLFVEVADKEFKLHGKPQTDSRITILTGVHRKDVRRIREVEAQTPSALKPGLGAQVIAKWISDPNYQDSNNTPRPLPRSGGENEMLSFDNLVESFSKDIRPKVLLDEWLNAGIISIDDHLMVKLNTDAFVPKPNTHEAMAFLGMNLHDHMAAAVNNLQTNSSPLFERCAFDDGLDLAQVREIEQLVKTQGMAFLKTINKAHVNTREKHGDRGGNYRVNTGVYFYFEPQNQTPEKPGHD